MPRGRCGSAQARSLASPGGHSAQGPDRAWQGRGHRDPGASGAPGPAGPGGDLCPHSQDAGPARAVCLSGSPKPPNVDRQWAVLGVMDHCPDLEVPEGVGGICGTQGNLNPPASSWTGQRSHRARLGALLPGAYIWGQLGPGPEPASPQGGLRLRVGLQGTIASGGPVPPLTFLGCLKGPEQRWSQRSAPLREPQDRGWVPTTSRGDPRRYGSSLGFHHSCEAGSGVQGGQRNWGFPNHRHTDAQIQDTDIQAHANIDRHIQTHTGT